MKSIIRAVTIICSERQLSEPLISSLKHIYETNTAQKKSSSEFLPTRSVSLLVFCGYFLCSFMILDLIGSFPFL